jgi:hypothetical protein
MKTRGGGEREKMDTIDKIHEMRREWNQKSRGEKDLRDTQ